MPERIITMPVLKKNGPLKVQLQGEIHTAPFSQKSCVWFKWIYSRKEISWDTGYTLGHGTESIMTAKSAIGGMDIYPNQMMLYIAPAFNNKAIVEGKNQYVQEFCLELGLTYYAFAEKFTYHLPPFRFFPFFPRRGTVLIPALSDEPLLKGTPSQPLIPIHRGRTG